MGRGSADEAIVAVKLLANEDAVTYLRVKPAASSMEAGGEGWNMISSFFEFQNNYCCEISQNGAICSPERISLLLLQVVQIVETTIQTEVTWNKKY